MLQNAMDGVEQDGLAVPAEAPPVINVLENESTLSKVGKLAMALQIPGHCIIGMIFSTLTTGTHARVHPSTSTG